ncbi:MAG: LAGLIDADG family homing endonuclease [Candidatus Kerfeldbacteria bacterium]|nr:LAGLIDADG family homing endonuclease [Candidatus Kerfeldbacteria bacterium]
MNWEYIAGFFDGEGSILRSPKGFRITIPQTNLDVLREIHQFTGVGNVIAVTKRQAHWKDSWVYYIAKQKDILFFLRHVQPYVIVKRENTLRAIPSLAKIVQKQNTRIRRAKLVTERAKELRKQEWTYRAIGKKLKIDWGYARRIILYK